MEIQEKALFLTAAFESDLLVDETLPKARKPYTITKQREKWTEEEHKKFLEALQLHGRNWRRIEEHIGTKTTIQIRSHAQKFFSKVSRESTNKNDGTSNLIPIHIPPPRPKRKPTRPYPRKLGSVESKQMIPALKKPEKPSLKQMVVDQQENGSPTSVLSNVASELAGSGSSTVISGCASPVASIVGSNEQDTMAQLSGSSVEEQIRCTTPQTDVTDSVPKSPLREESVQRSVHIATSLEEDMCVESDSPDLKLFGRTVAMKAVNTLNVNTDNSSSDKEMAAKPESTLIGLPVAEATGSSWHPGMLPFLYYIPPLPGKNNSSVAVAPFQLWGPYGVMPYPLIKPGDLSPKAQGICSDDSATKDLRRMGSFSGSSSGSNCGNAALVESGNNLKGDGLGFSSVKDSNEKPVRGFLPYKRCVVKPEKIEVKAMAEDGESELTRLCL
ncbi:hypothetical protein LUZ63_002813 [Rhynchospora breviuscula]|uniref:Uncharacterized protein n=1 Tax=Rhynchospora breviuscula TaxID=2022672 RepID=A0A9Q0HY48_9POAL|nr:hypothetical protein LUZ63_002813 [Rhynchospora breviuscula]